jgi:Fe-S cluster biogenesis protein NfuA
MFIQTQDTPNPETVKFITATGLPDGKTLNYVKGDDAKGAPLAMQLLRIEEVAAVFFTSDFISVTKHPQIEWEVLKPIVLSVMLDFFATARPIFDDSLLAVKDGQIKHKSDDNEIVKQIKEIIETRVRPAVAQDGGDIVYHDFRDGIVYLEMHGACSGCPSSTITLKNGIENLLKHYVPEVEAVESV